MDKYVWLVNEDLTFGIFNIKTMDPVGGPIETSKEAEIICKWLNDLTKKENE